MPAAWNGQNTQGVDRLTDADGEIRYQIEPLLTEGFAHLEPPEILKLPPPPDAQPEAVEPAQTEQPENDKPGSDREPEDKSPAPPEEVPAAETAPGRANLWGDGFLELWRFWEGNVELGLNGSTGNSETHTWRAGLHAARKSPFTELAVDANYKNSRRNSVVIADRLFIDWRWEWLFEDSHFTAFVHGTTEFDEFRAFDVRATADAGVGYQVVESDIDSLRLRAGAGAAREIGGPDETFVPEGVLGFNYTRKLTKKQRLNFKTEYFVDWTDWGDWRLNTKADWQIILDQEAHLSLKLGVSDRYDSTPNGANPNDLDYSALLLWSF